MYLFGKLKNTDLYGFGIHEESFETFKEISDEEHDRIIKEANEIGKPIGADENGDPIIVEPPEPSQEEKDKWRLEYLEKYLKETDWYAIRFADTGEAIPDEIKAKRQKAREDISELRKNISEVDKPQQ